MLTFERVCKVHKLQLSDSVTKKGVEVLTCPHGHSCRSWLIADSHGHIHGAAHMDMGGVLLGGFSETRTPLSVRLSQPAPPLPKWPCRNKHAPKWKLWPDGRYRCVTCRNDKERERRRKLQTRMVKIQRELREMEA